MLCDDYIEALLASKKLADGVWEVWAAGLIDDLTASVAWELVAISSLPTTADSHRTRS